MQDLEETIRPDDWRDASGRTVFPSRRGLVFVIFFLVSFASPSALHMNRLSKRASSVVAPAAEETADKGSKTIATTAIKKPAAIDIDSAARCCSALPRQLPACHGHGRSSTEKQTQGCIPTPSDTVVETSRTAMRCVCGIQLARGPGVVFSGN